MPIFLFEMNALAMALSPFPLMPFSPMSRNLRLVLVFSASASYLAPSTFILLWKSSRFSMVTFDASASDSYLRPFTPSRFLLRSRDTSDGSDRMFGKNNFVFSL